MFGLNYGAREEDRMALTFAERRIVSFICIRWARGLEKSVLEKVEKAIDILNSFLTTTKFRGAFERVLFKV